ncbi:hypothetical protein [Tautonia sociabilis]|uniref:Uncharacterized protein n=1 Tax=Tautonia sociabilis TaxID=2080755 RepID=A0A432MCM6_9BACT|nr:hypothetical protein [Tautonia sociabilis]RUL82004.1 hypothetical protein TsocGM_24170 [Tautonia sociabilis]
MLRESGIDDRLRRMVVEMRSEIDAVINEALDRLTGPSSGRSASPSGGGVPPEARTGRPMLLREPPKPPPAASPESTASRTRPGGLLENDRDRDRDRGGPEIGSNDDGPEDADRMLDALAMRLEGRLRRTRDRSANWSRPDDGGQRSGEHEAIRGG